MVLRSTFIGGFGSFGMYSVPSICAPQSPKRVWLEHRLPPLSCLVDCARTDDPRTKTTQATRIRPIKILISLTSQNWNRGSGALTLFTPCDTQAAPLLRGSQCTGGERRGEKKVTYKQVPDLTNVTRSGGIHMLRSSRGAEREQAKRRVESRLWIKYPGT